MTKRRHIACKHIIALGVLAFVLAFAPQARAGNTLVVDNDFADCPNAGFNSIQGAVAAASAGDAILVCPGSYYGRVLISGHAKDGISVIASGRQDEVILQRDPAQPASTQRNGFQLQDVNGVLIRGFTVRDFGDIRSVPPAVSGMGNNILLVNAHYNTIQQNRLTVSYMMGIFIVNSSNNLVEHNVTFDNDAQGFGCGIMLSRAPLFPGPAPSDNIIRHNVSYGQPLAGIMILNSGPGNQVLRNTVNNNGRFGIQNRATNGTLIADNRINSSRGLWSSPTADQMAVGIEVRLSTGVTVRDNVAHHNEGSNGLGFDVFWDGAGANTFSGNNCKTASQTEVCRQGGGRQQSDESLAAAALYYTTYEPLAEEPPWLLMMYEEMLNP